MKIVDKLEVSNSYDIYLHLNVCIDTKLYVVMCS